MAARYERAAILRDARKIALLRMRVCVGHLHSKRNEAEFLRPRWYQSRNEPTRLLPPRERDEPIAVRHRHLRQRLRVDGLRLRDDAVEVEQIRHHPIHL